VNGVASAGRRLPGYGGWLLLILVGLTGWRLLAVWHLDLELYADEAQYWSWSLTPDWGYYSKPPMVAWLIALTTRLFGDSELGVRAATFLIWPLTALVLYLLTRRLFDGEPWAERAAFWSAAAFACLPMTFLGGVLITTDGPLLLFWALTLYFLAGALEHDRWRDWLLAGAAAGLGLLSKYSMVFLAPAFLLYLLITPRHRRLLKSAKPYVAAGVALTILSPNLFWNARHDFVSFQHTAEISQLNRAWINPDAFLAFAGAQFGVFGPVMALGLLLLLLRPRALRMDGRLAFLATFSLVPLAAFLGLSLLSRAFANWAAFAYATGTILVIVTWVSQQRQRWLAWALSLNVALGALLYHYHDIARALDIQLTRKTDPYARITGYRALGRQVHRLLAAHPEARLLGDDRKGFASLLYYARPLSREAAYLNPSRTIGDHYALTADVALRPDGAYVLVTKGRTQAELKRWFTEVQALEHLHVRIHRDHALDYQAWLVRGFLGY
jgi:4-amino-4-deoxy-L-arabinose transferase-like glycosyltransferase